jgi:hypothetical protein
VSNVAVNVEVKRRAVVANFGPNSGSLRGGVVGPEGPDGRTVLSGAGAPGAGLGDDGDFYYRTSNSDFYGPKTAGAWGAPTSLKGIQGDPGHTILSGTTAPVGGTGADGDFYFRTTTSMIYGPKAGGAWPAGVSLIGATGPAAMTLPAPWVTGNLYTVGPPASQVTQGGETFVSTVDHVAGVFATDYGAGKWIRTAAKGADGTGTGTVVHSGAVAAGRAAIFGDTSGDLIVQGPAFGAAADANVPTRLDGDGRWQQLSAKDVANGYAGLDGGGKLSTSLFPAGIVGGLNYVGTWNATTNTPAIPVAAVGNKGQFYKVATAGTTVISGINDWQIGDWIVSNGASWDKIDNTDLVISVAGLTGAISAASLRAALTLVIGTDVQAWSSVLTLLAGLAPAADKLPYFTGVGAAAVTTLTTFARTLLDDVDAAAMRTTLGLGTMSLLSAITAANITDPLNIKVKESFEVAVSDEATAITTGVAKVTFRTRAAMTLSEVRSSLSAASSSGLVTVDVKVNGTSIFTTTLSIDATEKTSTTAASPAVKTGATIAIADDAEITIDITAAGTAAKGLKVGFLWSRT